MTIMFNKSYFRMFESFVTLILKPCFRNVTFEGEVSAVVIISN